MQREGEHDGEFCWGDLVARTIHPVQVQIIEALLWIDRPLSAGDLSEAFDGRPGTLAVLRHLERLTRLGVLAINATRRVRGARVRSFRLAAGKEKGSR